MLAQQQYTRECEQFPDAWIRGGYQVAGEMAGWRWGGGSSGAGEVLGGAGELLGGSG
jgi:hypothetical protein